jgi:multimeric flavodoxin WrbA
MDIGFFGGLTLVILFTAVVFVFKTVNVVPQQHAWVVERLGKYHTTLGPGLHIVFPFVDRIAYKHILKEIPLDVPPQVCITRDNTQLQVDGILYFQVTDPMRASYGSSNYIAAHGILIITPVHWYQAPSGLKLMMDRLVCADGGNPDPTSTHGKTASEAKKIELKGWDYPKHLKNRAFAVFVHGDAGGAESLRHDLTDWLNDMSLIPADTEGFKDRLIGYMQPYATSHDDLDKDQDVFKEIDNMAIALAAKVSQLRNHPELLIDKELLVDPRPK